MTGWRMIVAAAVGICFCLALAAWLGYRVNKFGINNVFSREHVFSDQRALTEQLAIEITRQALEADGYDTSVLAPVEHGHQGRPGHSDRFFLFQRRGPSDTSGRILWGPALGGSPDKDNAVWKYKVRIEQRGSEIRCRVYRGK